MAGYFLKAAADFEILLAAIEEIRKEIQICMFATGSGNLDQLQKAHLLKN